MNHFVSIISINKNMGRHRLFGNLLKTSSGNVLGAFFHWLTTGREDTGFVGKLKYTKKVMTNV